jgi:hypothetical protein
LDSDAAVCLKWVHARASVKRFEEEVKLLAAESKWVPKTFAYTQNERKK